MENNLEQFDFDIATTKDEIKVVNNTDLTGDDISFLIRSLERKTKVCINRLSPFEMQVLTGIKEDFFIVEFTPGSIFVNSQEYQIEPNIRSVIDALNLSGATHVTEFFAVLTYSKYGQYKRGVVGTEPEVYFYKLLPKEIIRRK